jgi:hypothetical protein
MAKKEKDKGEDELIKLPPMPRAEGEPEKAEEVEEPEVIEEEVKADRGNQPIVWTPKDVEALVRLGIEFFGTNLADKYLAYKKNDAEAKRRYFESVSTHNRRMIYVLISFLIGIVGFMSFLTWFGKISGDALLFLVGTITGYIIISVQRLVFPSEEPPMEETQT